MEAAFRLNPREYLSALTLGQIYAYTKDFAQAISLRPQSSPPYIDKAVQYLSADGSNARAVRTRWNYGRGDDPANPKYEFRCDVHYCSAPVSPSDVTSSRGLGGFDLRFAPMYYEDVDLAFAVRAGGRRVVYQPTCVIVHFEGGTAGTDTGSGGKRYQILQQKTFAEKWAAELGEQPAPGSNPDVARYRPTGPHVLIIDSYTPRPDRDAGSLRMHNLCTILPRLGCHVSFLPKTERRRRLYALLARYRRGGALPSVPTFPGEPPAGGRRPLPHRDHEPRRGGGRGCGPRPPSLPQGPPRV